jgi:Short C-terminal domain
MIAKLERLDQLYRNGALTHAEYERAKGQGSEIVLFHEEYESAKARVLK